MSGELILLIAAAVLVASVLLSKVSERFGVPTLLLFLGIGMLAGSDGPGGIYFDNARMAQALGTVALAYILFAGGLETDVDAMRRVVRPAVSLATLGVLATALTTGLGIHYLLGHSWMESLLIGAIVSSTDAAAVFAVLRSKNVGLKEPLRPLLELESGSNDPMAVFLTVGLIELIRNPARPVLSLIPLFLEQMIIGLVLGYLTARIFIHIINRVKLDYEGLYPVLALGWVLLTYALTAWLKGSGFLAVYITGLVLGKKSFSHKKSLIRFQDGIAWLMQILMFLTLGLLVFPSQLIPVAGQGLLVALFLILVARPAAVFCSLIPFRFSFREKHLISWVGLRGSVPIVLATFPMLAGLDHNHYIFNLVFFIVISSVLLQGTTIPLMARLAKVDAPLVRQRRYPIDFDNSEAMNLELVDLFVPYGSQAAGRQILELGFPRDCLITMISRNEKFIMPGGSTVLEEGDVLLILSSPENLSVAREILEKRREESTTGE
ncbi:MAG TPA: potassium/proton antiporter [bacterium]|nr:potassium/proton antiporter [bacterium]HQG45639.1 potassium/proton antiporter [bacterium]HQI49810.1 potassium/proton antiporter [bacterium]HQJ63000.1 potassium/proton antiporter [bacterium]